MKPIRQEDPMGCAVACVAFILNISYKEALGLFKDGEDRVRNKANFFCPELVKILNGKGLNYKWEKIENNLNEWNADRSIVFIGKSEKYLYGHFLSGYEKKWMDPWINLPEKNIRAGFRRKLSGEATYIIHRS